MTVSPSDWSWISTNVRPWITAIFSAGTFGIAVQFYRVWRRGRTDDAKLALDTDRLEVEEADGIRSHYASELKSLRDQIVRQGESHAQRARESEERHRAALRAADERFDKAMAAADEREASCKAEVRELRIEFRAVTDEVVGLRAQLGQTARSAIVLATHAPSLPIQEAADRAADALDKLNLPHSERPEQ